MDQEPVKIENVWTYDSGENGKLVSQETKTTTDVSKLGDAKEAVEEAIEDTKKAYEGKEGITYDVNNDGTTITENIKIDFTKFTQEQLEMMNIQADITNAFDLEGFTKIQTSSGFTCE